MAGVSEITVPVRLDLDASDLPEVTRLALRPGDQLVLSFPQKLSDQDFDEVMARVRALIPASVPVMILDGGVTLSVLAADPHGGE